MKNNNAKFTWCEKAETLRIYRTDMDKEDFKKALVEKHMPGILNVSQEEKYVLLNQIIECVETFDTVTETIRENDSERIEELLATRFQDRGEMEDVLSALCIAESSEATARMKRGETAEELQTEYIREHLADCTDEELTMMLKSKLFGLRLSSNSLDELLTSLESEDASVRTITCLGQKSAKLKIALALAVYCNNLGTDHELSVEEAVAVAYTNVEVQAVADAVGRGYMAAEIAENILHVVQLALGLCCAGHIDKIVKRYGNVVAIVGVIAAEWMLVNMTDIISVCVGQIAAWAPGVTQEGCRNVRAGLKKINAHLKRKEAAEEVQEEAEKEIAETACAYMYEEAAAEAKL